MMALEGVFCELHKNPSFFVESRDNNLDLQIV
jgi:hypothetical protein